MKKIAVILLLLVISVAVSAQGGRKTRHIADMGKSAVSARKISVQYTEGLKAYFSGRASEALKIFNGITLDDPKHDASYFMLSKIYTDQKNYSDAVDALQKAIKVDKKNVWYKVDLANVYFKKEDYLSAAKLWEQICNEKTNNEYYLYSLSECYMELGRPEKVIETYDRMEKIIGYNDELTRVKASLWLYMNRVKDAVGEYDKLIAAYPHTADYYVKAGNIYQSNGSLDKAYEYYQKAFEITPDDPQLNMALATYWEQKKNTEKTMFHLEKVFADPAVELSEKTPYMRSCMAVAARTRLPQDVSRADRLADALISAHPHEAEGYVSKARLQVLLSKYEEAFPLFQKAIQKDNTSYSLWEDFCYVINKLQRWQEILPYEQDINELFPQNSGLLYYIGMGYLQKKNADKAIDYLKQALTFTYEADNKSLIYQSLGDAYQLKGDADTARDYWGKVRK